MILIVDLCWKEDSLSRSEFVDPVANIVKASGQSFQIVHHASVKSVKMDEENIQGILFCGTALKDNGFRENLGLIEMIKNTSLPVLGVCAGMQVIALAYGGELEESPEIGMKKIYPEERDEIFDAEDDFEAYKLHGMRIRPGDNFITLASSEKGPEVIRHRSRPIWGVLFHPEVRNEWVVGNFVSFCRR